MRKKSHQLPIGFYNMGVKADGTIHYRLQKELHGKIVQLNFQSEAEISILDLRDMLLSAIVNPKSLEEYCRLTRQVYQIPNFGINQKAAAESKLVGRLNKFINRVFDNLDSLKKQLRDA